MSSRFWRWTFRSLAILLVLLGIGAIGLHLAMPSIVRAQVRNVLAQAGYQDATFNVESASAWGVRITDLRAGKTGGLNVSSMRINYSPLAAISGKIDSLRIERAGIVIDLDRAEAAEAKRHFDLWSDANAAGLPLWRIELSDFSITLVRAGHQYVVRADGWMWREQLDDRARLSLTLRAGEPATTSAWLEGNIRFTRHEFNVSAGASDFELAKVLPFLSQSAARQIDNVGGSVNAIATVVYGEGRAQTQGSLDLRDGRVVSNSWGVTLDGAAASVAFASLNPLRLAAGQRIHVDRVKVGEPNELTDLNITFDVDRRGLQMPTSAPDAPAFAVPPRVRFESISCNWAGGKFESDGPVYIHPIDKSISIKLVATGIGLNEVLRLVSSGKVSGQGSLSGRLPIRVDWPRVTIGTGRIASDASGEINFGQQIGELASSVAEKDVRLRGQRQLVMEALANFHYDQIVFEFVRTDEGLSVVMQISGRGKKGLTTPLDLTVRNVGLEEALNAYLQSALRVNSVGER